MERLDRELKLADDQKGYVAQKAPAHPLYACLGALLETSATTPGSAFEAKGGLRASLVAPRQGQDPVGELPKMAYVKRGIKDLEAHIGASNHWGCVAVSREAEEE